MEQRSSVEANIRSVGQEIHGFYGTRCFITIYTQTTIGSYAEPDESSHTLFFEGTF
jgi:hypothetical protein